MKMRFENRVQAVQEKYFFCSGSSMPLADIKNSAVLLEHLISFDLSVRQIRLSTKSHFQELLQKAQESLGNKVRSFELAITENQPELIRLEPFYRTSNIEMISYEQYLMTTNN